MQYLNHSINAVLYCIVDSGFRNELIDTLRYRKISRSSTPNVYTPESVQHI